MKIFAALLTSVLLVGCSHPDAQPGAQKTGVPAAEKASPQTTRPSSTPSIEELIALLNSDRDQDRIEAAREIEKLGPKAAIANVALVKLLSHTSQPVQDAVAKAILAIGPSAIGVLCEDLIEKRSFSIGGKGGRFGQRAKSTLVADERKLTHLIGLLKEGPAEKRLEAAKVIVQMGPRAAPAVPTLVSAIDLKTPSLAAACIAALGKIGPSAKESCPRLLEIARDPQQRLLEQSIAALQGIGEPSLPFLDQLLGDRPDHRGVLAAVAMVAIDKANAKAKPFLVKSLALDDRQVVAKAIDGLLLYQPPPQEAIDWLIADLVNSPENTLENLLQIGFAEDRLSNLGEMSRPHVENALLTHPKEEVRTACADILRMMDPVPVKSVGALAKALSDPDRDVRLSVASTLLLLHENARPASRELLVAARDPDTDVARMALRALTVADPDVKVVLDGLIDVLEDPRDGVREIAPTALANLGPGARPAIPRLMKLLGDTSNEARMRAAIAILRIQPHHPKLAATAPALVELLKSSPCADEDSEKDARKALEYIGAPALPLLIQAVLEKAATRREHKAQIDQLVQEELKKNGLNDHQDPTADKPSE